MLAKVSGRGRAGTFISMDIWVVIVRIVVVLGWVLGVRDGRLLVPVLRLDLVLTRQGVADMNLILCPVDEYSVWLVAELQAI